MFAFGLLILSVELCWVGACSMNTIATALILLLLPLSSVNAQDQESLEKKLHRAFPKSDLIRPSIPPWHFNFDLHRWEQDDDLVAALPVDPVADLKGLLVSLAEIRALPEHKAKRRRHRKHRSHAHPMPR
jgi:hypothetical protein